MIFKPIWEIHFGSKREAARILILKPSSRLLSMPLPPYLRFHTVQLREGTSGVFFKEGNNFFTRNANAFEKVNLHFFFRTDVLPDSLFVMNYLNRLVFPNFLCIRKFKIRPFDVNELSSIREKRFQREWAIFIFFFRNFGKFHLGHC